MIIECEIGFSPRTIEHVNEVIILQKIIRLEGLTMKVDDMATEQQLAESYSRWPGLDMCRYLYCVVLRMASRPVDRNNT